MVCPLKLQCAHLPANCKHQRFGPTLEQHAAQSQEAYLYIHS